MFLKEWMGRRKFTFEDVPATEYTETNFGDVTEWDRRLVPADNIKGRLCCFRNDKGNPDGLIYEVVKTEIPPIVGGSATVVLKPFGSDSPNQTIVMLFQPFVKKFVLLKETKLSKVLHLGPLKKDPPKRDD